VALIETTAPVCVERFSDYPQLGRFTLRDEGRTIAIGKVYLQRLMDAVTDSPCLPHRTDYEAHRRAVGGSNR
jgi:hypothetical protein